MSFLDVKWTGHGVNHPPSSGTKVNEKCRASYTSAPPLFLHDILQAELYLFHFYHYVYVFTGGEKKKKEVA